MANPLGTPGPWNLVARGYDEFVVPMLEKFSDQAISSLELSEHSHVLDIACGPGTAVVQLAKQGHPTWAVDFSPAMVEQLEAKLSADGTLSGTPVDVQLMDGQALDFTDNRFDAGMSMFGLMFFRDRARGFRELHRVLKPGGRACVSSWLPIAEVPALQWIFGAFSTILPKPEEGAPAQLPLLEDPEVFRAEMTDGGFSDVTVRRQTHRSPMPTDAQLPEFWEAMVDSSAPMALFKKGVDANRWAKLSETALTHLIKTFPRERREFEMHAWVATGRKTA